MSYYQFCKILRDNGWQSIKLYNSNETWHKDGNTKQISVTDVMSKSLLEGFVNYV